MTPLHTEKTETFYQEVLKINLKSAMHSSRAHGLEEPLEQLRLEAEWSADEVACALETRLTDAQLAGIEADVKSRMQASESVSRTAEPDSIFISICRPVVCGYLAFSPCRNSLHGDSCSRVSILPWSLRLTKRSLMPLPGG